MHTPRHANDALGPNRTTPDLHVGLASGMRTPLAALRASLETLAQRFEERDPRRPQVSASVSQVARIQHNLQTILDAQQPTPLRPLACTLQEIVHSAVGALVPEHRSRVFVAVEGGCERVFVDGPLVSRALTRLLESGLEQGTDPALLRVRAHAGRASFSVLHARFDAAPGSIEDLATSVAERETLRMGGSFVSRAAPEHRGVFEITFDLAAAGEEAA